MAIVNWKDEDALRKVCAEHLSQKDILIALGLGRSGAGFQTLKKYCKIYNIELPDGNKTKKQYNIRHTLEEILVENSTYTNTGSLKARLIREGLLDNRCPCGIIDEWQGKPIVLQLDHINGKKTDNRIENLRMLCPNCHSQTITWGRKTRHGD